MHTHKECDSIVKSSCASRIIHSFEFKINSIQVNNYKNVLDSSSMMHLPINHSEQ